MTMQDYVESLRDKHAFLEQQIDAEMHRPLPDQLLLSRLKREKLKIKDEMVWGMAYPPSTASGH
jgi:hypothetical protein